MRYSCLFSLTNSPQQHIYDSIRKREIIMPEEHTGRLGFEYAWKELLARSRQSGPPKVSQTCIRLSEICRTSHDLQLVPL